MWETGQDRQDQGATSKSLRPVCHPWMVGQALDTRSLPASDATSLPSSATLGVGKQWGYSGDEMTRMVMEYILKTRIVLAKNDLRKTVLPVAQIGDSAGFSSPAYFCRVFKQETGLTPLQYRRQKTDE